MITGYNTDVEYEGVVYHVQTEDKGLQTPIILSLVYVGGAILASKRAPYDDLITSGFDKQILAERLQRQHMGNFIGRTGQQRRFIAGRLRVR